VVSFVLGAFNLSVAQPVGFVGAALDLTLHGERELECHRSNGLDQQLADGFVDLDADDALAERISEEKSTPNTHVVGDELASALYRPALCA
jgi:hypothetical protein